MPAPATSSLDDRVNLNPHLRRQRPTARPTLAGNHRIADFVLTAAIWPHGLRMVIDLHSGGRVAARFAPSAEDFRLIRRSRARPTDRRNRAGFGTPLMTYQNETPGLATAKPNVSARSPARHRTRLGQCRQAAGVRYATNGVLAAIALTNQRLTLIARTSVAPTTQTGALVDASAPLPSPFSPAWLHFDNRCRRAGCAGVELLILQLPTSIPRQPGPWLMRARSIA